MNHHVTYYALAIPNRESFSPISQACTNINSICKCACEYCLSYYKYCLSYYKYCNQIRNTYTMHEDIYKRYYLCQHDKDCPVKDKIGVMSCDWCNV